MSEEKRVTKYSGVTKILLWLLVSSLLDYLVVISISGLEWSTDAIIKISLGAISSVSTTGILFFLGAIVFMSSRRFKTGYEQRGRQIVKQFLLFVLLTTLYLMVFSTFVFNYYQRFGEVGASLPPEFLYGALIAVPVVALVFCLIATGLTVLLDDWRLTLLVGCTLFFLGNLFFGMPSANTQYPEISLFSPSQFYRGMILLCIGFYMIIPHSLKFWGGLVSPTAMVLPILFYISLTLISLRTIKVYGQQNLYYRQLQALTGSIEENEGEHREAFRLRSQLKSRTKSVIVGFLIAGLLLPTAGYTYTSARTYESFTVIHEEIIEPINGELFYGSFVTEVPIPDITRWIGFPFIVIDWGLYPGPIQFEYVLGIGTTYDFLSMNENDRWRLAQRTNLEHETTEYHVHKYTGIDESAGVYYWAFRFVGDGWTSDFGSIVVRISVVLREKAGLS